MKISKEVEVATITFMKNLEGMRPLMIRAQTAAYNEMCKGKDRELIKVIDLVIEAGELGCRYAVEYVKECQKIGGTFVHPQVSAITRAYQTGDFSQLDELSEEVRLSVMSNRTFNQNLEKDMVEKFGANAMTIMLAEDGLIPEFQRRTKEMMVKS